MIKIILLVLCLVTSLAFADESIIGTDGQNQLVDNAGHRWNAHAAYTTNGDGDIYTLGGLLAADNYYGDPNSGTHYLLDNNNRKWILDVFYTTDGNGNVIPITGGGGGGGGITSLNSLTAATQTMVPGTSGTDFNIAHSSSTHTFNLPTVSGSARGLVTSSLFNTWNGKQDALGFTPENVANKDTDGTLAANSDTRYSSQKAVKTYVDASSFGRLRYLGDWDNLTNYVINDVATLNGVGYVCIQANHSGSPDNNPSLWAQLGFPVLDQVTNGVTSSAPTQNAVYDSIASSLASAETYADGKVQDSIIDGVTDKAPSQNAVFDAIAPKVSYLGAYDSARNYLVNDEFLFGGIVYITISASGHGYNPPDHPEIYTPMFSYQFPIIATEGGVGTGYVFGETGNDTGMASPSDGRIDFWDNNSLGMYLESNDLHVTGNISAANFPTTGTGNTIAAFDSSGAISSLPSWGFQDVTGNTNHTYTSTPVTGTGVNGEYKQITVQPASTSSGDSHTGIFNTIIFDPGVAGFDMNAGVTSGTFRTEKHGNNTLDYASSLDNSMFFTDSGATTLAKGNSLNTQIVSGATVTNYDGVDSYLNSEGVSDGINMFDSSGQLNNATANNFNTFNSYANFSGTTAIAQTIQGSNINLSMQDTASTQNIFAGTASVNQGDASTSQNVQGLSSNIQMSDTSVNSGGINGINNGIDIHDGSTAGGINGYNLNVHVRNTATSGYINGAIFGVNTNDTAVVQGISGITVNPNMSGSSSIQNVTVAQVGGNLNGSAHIDNYNGLTVSPQAVNGSTVTNFTAANISANIQDTAAVSNQVNGLQVSVSSPADSLSDVQGLSVNVENAHLKNSQSALGHQKAALNVSGGASQLSSDVDTSVTTVSGEFQHNLVGGQLTVAAGHPVANTIGFGNNLGVTALFLDDYASDGLGIGLGYSVNGLVNQTAVASGKIVDYMNWMTAGGGIPTYAGDGGTISNANMFNAVGLLPEGGNLTVTNMSGFRVSPILCLLATNCWGVHIEDTSADNWFAKDVVVGGSTGKPESGVALDVTGSVKATEGVKLSTSGSQPTCDAGHRGMLWNIEGGAGVADVLQVCQKTVLDTYVWTTH